MTTPKERDYTLQYSLIPFCYWGAFASIVSYASFYLLSIGYKNAAIGIIIAIAGAFSAVLQPLVAGFADATDRFSLKQIVLALLTLQILGYVLLFTIHGKAFLLSGIIYGVEIALQQILTPLVNSLGTETLNQGKKLNYGVARAFGSIGYAILAFLLGRIISNRASSSILLCTIAVLILFELFLVIYPFQKTRKAAAKNTARVQKKNSIVSFFLRYKKFSFLLFGCVLIYISHVMINNFTLQIVQSKGGGAAEMGTAQAFASIIELPVMFLFTWMATKASYSFWFRISGFFFFLKTFATLLAPNIPVFYGVQLFQMFGWALITVASVYYVNSVMEDTDKIKGQAYFTMTYTLGTVFGSLLGGYLIDHFSANAMLACGSGCALAGAILMFLLA